MKMNSHEASKETWEKHHTKSFVSGAFILGLAGLLAKILGALFRIPLGRMLTPEEMSYFSNAYSIYTFVAVIATTGIPIAMAKYISQTEKSNLQDQIMKKMKRVMFVFGGLMGGMVFFLAPWIAQGIGNPEAQSAIRALSPGIFFICMMASYRGLFQGKQEMAFYGWSQIIEQVAKVATGILLAYVFVKGGSELAPAGATFGVTAGTFFGYLYVVKKYRNKSPSKKSEAMTKNYTKEILKFAVPVTIGISIWPFMNALDTVFVINSLITAGLGEYANDLFGILGGYVLSIVNLPLAISSAIQLSIVPAVVKAAKADMHKEMAKFNEKGFKMVLLVMLPAAVGFMVMGQEIFALLYPSRPEIYLIAGRLLGIMGLGIIFLALYQVSSGILQGLGHPMVPAKNMLLSSLVKIILVIVLCRLPEINIYGAALSSLATFIVAWRLNARALYQVTGHKIDWKSILVIPLFITLSMGGLVLLLKASFGPALGSSLSTCLIILVAALYYGGMCWGLKVITPEELKALGTKKENV